MNKKVFIVFYLKNNNLNKAFYIAKTISEAKEQFLAKNKVDTNQIVSISELYGNNNKSFNFNFVVNTLKKIKKQIEEFVKKLNYKHYIAIGLLILIITGWNIYKSNKSNSYNYSQDYEEEDEGFRQAEIEASKKLNTLSNNHYKNNPTKYEYNYQAGQNTQSKKIKQANVNPNLKEEISNTINLKTISYKLKTIKATTKNRIGSSLEVIIKKPIELIGNQDTINIIKTQVSKKLPYFNYKSIESFYNVIGINKKIGLSPYGGYYINISIKPISETDKIICLEDSSFWFNNGVTHDFGGITYTCYNKISGRVLKLNDVLNIDSYENKENLNRVAEKYFRIKNNITAYTPLKSIGLFENKFKLAENYYFTDNGIIFYYNPYDIAPYGATGRYKAEFMIPYKEIASIITQNAELGEYAKLSKNESSIETKNNFEPTYKQNLNSYKNNSEEEIVEDGCDDPVFNKMQDTITLDNTNMDIKLHYKIIGTKIKFDIVATNLSGKSLKGGVSISFPAIYTNIVTKTNKGSFGSLKAYPKGAKIWSKALHQAIPANYLLVEAWSNKWRARETKRASFEMYIKNIAYLKTQLRGVLLNKRTELLTPQDGIIDQQGYGTIRVGIDLPNKYILPKQTYSNSSYEATYKVVKVRFDDTLNVRSTPFITKYNKIGELLPYTKGIKVINCKYNKYGKKWCRINHSTTPTGWVRAKYIQKEYTYYNNTTNK